MTGCQQQDCSVKSACFGFKDDNSRYCSKHKKPDMIDLVHKRCFCGKYQPSFGLKNGKATHCSKCKTSEMSDIHNKRCFCGKASPVFGLEIDNKLTHCFKCKTPDMINLKENKCFCGKVRPTFGLIKGKATHCTNCKTSDMINVLDRKCFCGKVRPTFGLEKGKATHCQKCKTDKMYNVNDKLCYCKKKQPSFGLKHGKSNATHCNDCKLLGMFNVISKRCYCDKALPTFGLDLTKPATHCFNCKTIDMFDVINKKCLTELCNTQANNRYDGYCAYCYGNIYPDSLIVKNYKTKERLVVDFVRQKFPNYNWKFDVIIKGASSRRRPDIFLDLGKYIIIIEIDENQHKKYDCICENKRLMELSKDVLHKSIIFIRFNPDQYIDKNNNKILSCFSITQKTGVLHVNNNTKWSERLRDLKNAINYWLKYKTNKIVEIIQLYYDGY